MFTIKGHGCVWDAEREAPLFRFENGEYKTNDEKIATKARDLGYNVTGKADRKQVATPKEAVEDTKEA